MGEGSSTYEALQYLQSFVARKRRALGKKSISSCVFHGAGILVSRDAADEAGTLLEWFIESDDLFNIGYVGNNDDYCDMDNVYDYLSKLEPLQAEPVIQHMNGPLHQRVIKSGLLMKHKSVQEKLSKIDLLFADVFEKTCKWHHAYKMVIRLGDITRGAKILNNWSLEAYKYEKPLFYARAILTLLSERKIEQAVAMTTAAEPYMSTCDNIDPARPSEEDSGPLACWHLSQILSELISQPERERVDKNRLFNVLTTLYAEILDRMDVKLLELYQKVGIICFNVRSQESVGPDPMAMLQGLMQAGAPKMDPGKKKHAPGTIGGMNPSQMLAMLDAMQGK
jgi:hypothetical protein